MKNSYSHWVLFGMLFVAALIGSSKYAPAILVIVAFVFFFIGYFWLCARFPRTMFVISILLFGGRRR
jgi:hypothetical protein